MISTNKMKSVEDIALFLIQAEKPLPETVLLKFAFDIEDFPGSSRDLFEKHFTLYHGLYTIKNEWGKQGFFIHLHPLRIRLLKTAEGCTYYFPAEGVFCGERLVDGICPHRHPVIEDSHPEYDCVRSFYEDESNIEWSEYEKMEKIRKGLSVYACRISDVKAALSCLGFSSPQPGYVVRNRYWELARKYHPDRGGCSDDMKRLNESYTLLKSVFVV